MQAFQNQIEYETKYFVSLNQAAMFYLVDKLKAILVPLLTLAQNKIIYSRAYEWNVYS